jgi:hypothetical protein
MSCEDGVDTSAQLSNAFAMDDADLENTPFTARSQVIPHQPFYCAWLERMQIQDAIDWNLDRLLIHLTQRLRYSF